MILLCAQGLQSKDVAERLGVHEHTTVKEFKGIRLYVFYQALPFICRALTCPGGSRIPPWPGAGFTVVSPGNIASAILDMVEKRNMSKGQRILGAKSEGRPYLMEFFAQKYGLSSRAAKVIIRSAPRGARLMLRRMYFAAFALRIWRRASGPFDRLSA